MSSYETHALAILFLFVFIASKPVRVHANHLNCITLDCSDMCNFHGTWVNGTVNNENHGYCVCDDMYYTLEVDHDHDHLTHHEENTNCMQRRKSQLTAVFLHVVFGMFSASHWYLNHIGIATAQMLLGVFGGFSICGAWKHKGQKEVACAGLCSLVFCVWWFVDLILFVKNNHYMDEYGERLSAW